MSAADGEASGNGARLSLNPFHLAAGPAAAMLSVPPASRLSTHALPPEVARRIVHDEVMLDGNARQNLATFVTTWMEPEGAAVMAECRDKNLIDKDEYPRTAEIERRCVAILADL